MQSKIKITNTISKLSSILIPIWCVSFVIFGGLGYRLAEAASYDHSRSFILSIVLKLFPIIQLSVAVLWQDKNQAFYKKNWLTFMLIILLLVSGSRGYSLQIILTILFLNILSNKLVNFLRSIRELKIQNPKSKFLIVLFGGILFLLYSAISANRETELTIIQANLFRLSEPYWFAGFLNSPKIGVNYELFNFAIDRLISIPGRLIGLSYPFSIDGSNYILERWLNIFSGPGISLPMPYIGEGYMIFSYNGALFAQLFTCFLIYISYCIIYNLPFEDEFKICLLSIQLTAITFIYSSSITGSVNVLVVSPLKLCVSALLLYYIRVLMFMPKMKAK